MCKHLNMQLDEWYKYFSTSHNFEDGRYTDSYNKEGDYTNIITVECDDCGMVRNYSRRNIPHWLELRLEQITER